VTWLLLALGVAAGGTAAIYAARRSPAPRAAGPAQRHDPDALRRELDGLHEQLAEGELSQGDYRLLRDRLAAQLALPAEPTAAASRGRRRSGLWIAGFAAATLAAVVLVVPALRQRLPGMTPTGNNFIAPQMAAPQLTAPQFIALLRKAQALDRSGRLAQALPIYRMAVIVLPQRADLRTQLGFALARTGKTAEALLQLRRALRLSPRYPLPHLYLAAILIRDGQRDEARAQLKRFLRLQPTGSGARLARRLLRGL